MIHFQPCWEQKINKNYEKNNHSVGSVGKKDST
jgi:hypothetical protein